MCGRRLRKEFGVWRGRGVGAGGETDVGGDDAEERVRVGAQRGGEWESG